MKRNALHYITKIICIFTPVFFLFSCHGIPLNSGGSHNEPIIRVAVLKRVEKAIITGEILSVNINGKEEKKYSNKIVIESDGKGIKTNDDLYFSDTLDISGKAIKLNGKSYHGVLSVIREDGVLIFINRISLEKYLAGVINHEISSAWPIESVKAQAVAARTYAYEKIRSRKDKSYHLESTVMDQVYGGSGSEDERAIRAVLETKGEVLYYGGKLARAFYHSSCGGHTEASKNVWGHDYPYLRSIEDEYCMSAPNYFWTYTSDLEDIVKSLKNKNYKVGENDMPEIIKKDSNGRVVMFKIGEVLISGTSLREAIGYDRIKSTLFNMEVNGKKVIFSGSGSGHGVGMCQWGAKGMAEENYNYREILQFYYRGTEIRKLY